MQVCLQNKRQAFHNLFCMRALGHTNELHLSLHGNDFQHTKKGSQACFRSVSRKKEQKMKKNKKTKTKHTHKKKGILALELTLLFSTIVEMSTYMFTTIMLLGTNPCSTSVLLRASTVVLMINWTCFAHIGAIEYSTQLSTIMIRAVTPAQLF
jgi:hypothetical protein